MLTAVNIDLSYCAPFQALADITNIKLSASSPEVAVQMLRDEEAQLSLIPLEHFFNHGGYRALPYGLIANDLNRFSCRSLTSSLSRQWFAETKRPCPLAIWALNNDGVSTKLIAPFFEIGITTAQIHIRDWLQRQNASDKDLQLQLTHSISYKFESSNLDLLIDFVGFGVNNNKFPRDAVEILNCSLNLAKPRTSPYTNQRISLHSMLKLVHDSTLADLALTAPPHKSSTNYSSTKQISALSCLELAPDINQFELLFASHAKDSTSKISLSASDIHILAYYNSLSYRDVLQRLKHAGIKELNAAGGEYLGSIIQTKLSQSTLSAKQWLAIHQQAHQNELSSSAIIEATSVLTWRQYLQHLLCIRSLQDETQGFKAIIISPSATKALAVDELLRLYFITNIFIDNIVEVSVAGNSVSPATHNFFAALASNY